MRISYLPPLGEQFQHEITSDTTLLHTDVYLLFNMANLSIGDRIADCILERCNKARISYDDNSTGLSFDDALTSAVPEAFDSDTLNDAGRFNQSLNAQKQKIESKLKRIDDYRAKLKSDKERAKLDKLISNLRSHLNSVFGDDDSNS